MALAFLFACDSPTSSDPGNIGIRADGYNERGGILTLTALSADSALSSSNVTWTATPAAAVEWLGTDSVRMLQTGVVSFTARSGDARGTLDVNVTAPPRVVFVKVIDSNRDVWSVDLDGGDLRRLTSDVADDRSPSTAENFVYFLSNRVQPAAVYRVAAAGGAAERITSGTSTFTDPRISPDAGRLTFTRIVSGLTKSFHSSATGSTAERVTTSSSLDGGIEASPAWSSDSRSVAFVSTAAGSADIYVAITSSSALPRRLTTHAAANVEPSWSFDDRRIAFVRAQAGVVDLMIADATTGVATSRLSTTGSLSQPAWLADGRIVLISGSGSAAELHWLNPDSNALPVKIPVGEGIPSSPTALRK